MDTWTLDGSYTLRPVLGNPSADPSITAPLSEAFQLSGKSVQTFELADDSPVSVQFPAGFAGNVLVVRATGGKVRVRVTSADGATQAVPVEPLLVLLSQTVPFTAVDLTRETGVVVDVTVFLGDVAD